MVTTKLCGIARNAMLDSKLLILIRTSYDEIH